jgi:Ran GTPase-activating protein (RanGAP) involved in mRNA processing and transport
MSWNSLEDIDFAELFPGILRSNKTITTLGLSGNEFGQSTGAVECIVDGLGSNSTLLKIDLTHCALGNGGISTLAQTLGSRNTTLQKLTLGSNSFSSTGVGMLLDTSHHITNLEMMEQNSHHIMDLDLEGNPTGNEGASLLARSLGNNALPNLTHLSLSDCMIGDDGFIALVLALEQTSSLLYLHFCDYSPDFCERAFLALAESLPEIKVLKRVALSWCPGLASAMPLLLAGLRKNTSLFCLHVQDCATSSVPPTAAEMDKRAGCWMQEMDRLGHRNAL